MTPMNTQDFLDAVGKLAASFGWEIGSFTRDEEFVAVAPLSPDPSFEQIVWILGAGRDHVRCLLITHGTVPAHREAAVIELCARINDGLLFGCAEYSFGESTMHFRDSVQLGHGTITDLIESITGRVLGLGSRCAPAVRETLAGASAAEAMKLLARRDES